jgi:hypothetical protein
VRPTTECPHTHERFLVPLQTPYLPAPLIPCTSPLPPSLPALPQRQEFPLCQLSVGSSGQLTDVEGPSRAPLRHRHQAAAPSAWPPPEWVRPSADGGGGGGVEAARTSAEDAVRRAVRRCCLLARLLLLTHTAGTYTGRPTVSQHRSLFWGAYKCPARCLDLSSKDLYLRHTIGVHATPVP